MFIHVICHIGPPRDSGAEMPFTAAEEKQGSSQAGDEAMGDETPGDGTPGDEVPGNQNTDASLRNKLTYSLAPVNQRKRHIRFMLALHGFPPEKDIAVSIKPCRILVPTLPMLLF